ncbi:tetratricopeptide repeat protein [Lacibacterium aquatile]|uniref:Tetratricopeptide repeat protein n=1 Tax=Lacibacterium aquatile TaxID=1168082 RepID=A0ABW5DS97_9PROT
MPFFVLSLLVQVACVVHIMRTGRERFWIYVVVLLPMAGTAAYLVAEVLPGMIGARTSQKMIQNAGRAINPTRDLRRCEQALDMADTISNRQQLAEQYMIHGRPADAEQLYARSLVGMHADDPTLLLGLAQARHEQGNFDGALECFDHMAGGLESLSPEATLFYARCLEGARRTTDAISVYERIADAYSGEEARCRYAMLLYGQGRVAESMALFQEILKRADRAKRGYRQDQKAWIDIARQAMAAAR